MLRAKLEQQRLRGSSYLLSFLPLAGTTEGLVGSIPFRRHRGCHLAIRCGIASIEIDSAERTEHRLQLLVFLPGSLAVRYRFDILRTLSLRPPTNLAGERRLWHARAVTVLPPVVAPRPSRRPARPRRARTARTAGRDGLSGNLSFSGLEALWVAGGGPAWAEYQAAEVGERESGGQQ